MEVSHVSIKRGEARLARGLYEGGDRLLNRITSNIAQVVAPAKGRLRRLSLAGLFILAAVIMGPSPAIAVHDTGAFQLDGNAQQSAPPATPGDDWDNVCHQYSGASNPDTFCATTANTTGSTAGLWTSDGSLNATIFTGGGSKDPQNIDQWAWKDGAGGLPDKDNLLHAFSARYSLTPSSTCPSGGAATCEVIYFGADRFDNSGDAQQGFWFLQNKIGLGSNPVGGGSGFTSLHKTGDVLVISDFSNGGGTSTITVFTWDPACTATNKPFSYCGDANLHTQETSAAAKCAPSLVADPFCGIVNPTNGTIVPWSSDYTDKSGNHSYLNGEFYEAGINLSTLGLGGECFSSMLAETRSSTSTTATLKDFVVGTFGGCVPHMTTTASSNGPLLPGQPVHDTANMTVTGATSPDDPTGDVTFFLCGPIAAGADCSSGGSNVGTGALNGGSNTKDGSASADSPTVNDISKTGANGPLSPGHYCFRAEWPGDANYAGPVTFTDSTSECFDVAKLPTNTVTTPVDGSGTETHSITLGDSIFDKAVVTGSAAGGDPTGDVNFFVCGPVASGTCDTGGSAVAGNPQTLVSDGNPSTFTSSATSGSFTPGSVGRYCFRAEYGGSLVYNPSSDSGPNECFVVNDTTSLGSHQTWLPNDSATLTSAHGAPLNGTLSFTLHEGGDCTGTVLRPAESFTITNGTSPVTRSTTNTTVSVDASDTVSWEVVFTSTDPNVAGSSKCEITTLTITN